MSFLTYGAIGLTGIVLAIATMYDGNDENIKLDEAVEEEPTVAQSIASAVGMQSKMENEESNKLPLPSREEIPPEIDNEPKSDSSSSSQTTGVFGGKKKRNKNKSKKTKRQRGGKKARKTKHRKQNK